jgi:hypothetical protein
MNIETNSFIRLFIGYDFTASAVCESTGHVDLERWMAFYPNALPF